MLKLKKKSRRALLKRIKITATGKWMFKRANKNHLALGKTTAQKRHLRKTGQIDRTDYHRLKQAIL